MRHRCHHWVARLLFCAALFLTAPTAVRADPIPIDGGFMTLYWDGCCGGLGMQGPGFWMGIADNFHVGHSLRALTPGTTADPNVTIHLTGRGGARIDGEPVQNPDDPFGVGLIYFGGSLFFDAQPFLVTDATPESLMASFSTTFRMTGTLIGYRNFDRTGPPLFSVDLTGQGTTQLGPFRRFDEEVVAFVPIHANQLFTFEPADVAPTPEPATLLLLGTGLAGVAMRARRRT